MIQAPHQTTPLIYWSNISGYWFWWFFFLKHLQVILLSIQFCVALECEGLPVGTSGKEPSCQCRRHKRCKVDPWVKKIPRGRAWQATPVFSPGESYGQRGLENSWWATVHGVTESWAWLKGLSMHICMECEGLIIRTDGTWSKHWC